MLEMFLITMVLATVVLGLEYSPKFNQYCNDNVTLIKNLIRGIINMSTIPNNPEEVIQNIAASLIRISKATIRSIDEHGFISTPDTAAYNLKLYIESFIKLMDGIGKDAKTLGQMAGFIKQYNTAYVQIFASEEFTIRHSTGSINHTVTFGVVGSEYKILSMDVSGGNVDIVLNQFAAHYPKNEEAWDLVEEEPGVLNYIRTRSDNWKSFMANTPSGCMIIANGRTFSRSGFLEVLCTEKLERLRIAFGQYDYSYGMDNDPPSWNVMCNIDDDNVITEIIEDLIKEVQDLFSYDKYLKVSGGR